MRALWKTIAAAWLFLCLCADGRAQKKKYDWRWGSDTYQIAETKGEALKHVFAAHGSTDPKHYVVYLNSGMPHAARIKAALTAVMKKEGLADDVLFAKLRHARRGATRIVIGKHIPVALGRSVLRALLDADPAAPVVVRADLVDEFPGDTQQMIVGSLGEAKTAPASKELLAGLVDPKTTQDQFVKLLAGQELLEHIRVKPFPDGLVAHYKFDGNGRDSTDKSPEFKTTNVEYMLGAMYLNGLCYRQRSLGKDRGYRACADVPGVSYKALTVTLVFYATEFQERNAFVTFGTWFRWLTLRRNRKQHLEVMFNNRREKLAFETEALQPHRWSALTVAFDSRGRRVKAWLDGRSLGENHLPDGFVVDAALASKPRQHQQVSFINHYDAGVFHGLIDDLIIHNGYLADAAIETLHKEARLASKPAAAQVIAKRESEAAAARKKKMGWGKSLCTKEILEKSRHYRGTWRLNGEWIEVSDWVKATYEMGSTLYIPMRLENCELFGVYEIPTDAPNPFLRVHWNGHWGKGNVHFSYAPKSGDVRFGVWQVRAKKYNVGQAERAVPFCVRIRGDEAALFMINGDKPLAVEKGMSARGPSLMINMRGYDKATGRIGRLFVRPMPPKMAMDAPVAPPTMPSADDPGAWKYGAKDR